MTLPPKAVFYLFPLSRKTLSQHRSGKGAKYTRGRGPLELVYLEVHDTKSEAMSREARIKRFTKREKLNLLGTEEWRLELTGTELELLG